MRQYNLIVRDNQPMFTPQKLSPSISVGSFSAGSFQNTLRKYQTSVKQPGPLQPLGVQNGEGGQGMSQEERMARYVRVREEEMARSRSRIKRIKENRRELEKSRSKPMGQFQVPAIELRVIGSQCFSNVQMEFNEGVGEEEVNLEEKTIHVNSDEVNEGVQQMEVETEVYLHQQLVEVIDPIPLQSLNTPSIPIISEMIVEEPFPLPQPSLPFEYSNSRSESLVEQLYAFPSTPNPTDNCLTQPEISLFDPTTTPNGVQLCCLPQTSGGCILIKHQSIYYRISLRQLTRIWKQMNNLDSLVHYICNHRPHLAPLKESISTVLGSYLL